MIDEKDVLNMVSDSLYAFKYVLRDRPENYIQTVHRDVEYKINNRNKNEITKNK